MKLSFECGDEISRDVRQLPADYYKKILLLFSRSQSENLFIPIRNMQYLAVIANDEIVFIDGLGARRIELAWRNFRHETEVLDDPVSYDSIIFEEKGANVLVRLQGEFLKALAVAEAREPRTGSATVTPLDRT
ncbi:hypothetical protein DFR30_2833 [Thiogranum longum]|uniref:Uncharacterized protein n=1 Tax=Thiogranum longum TaxID=1537524 RepID=A0A4R1HGV3_9GAMM|nr:hypothetical protein [Thiogranum longum]TCK19520.1 hypothetical protein DFR30_2833 [Thiogranum longum]